MHLILNFIGLHLLTQGMLLAAFLAFRPQVLAVYALWRYDPALFAFYAAGISAQVWLIWTWIRRYLLFRSVGGKAGQAARTRGFGDGPL